MFLCDEQIPHPLPEGVSVFISPDMNRSPVMVRETEADYWTKTLDYVRLPAPSPGHVQVVISGSDNRYATSATSVTIAEYPQLPDGERYHVIGAYGVPSIVVPDWCTYDRTRTGTRPQGPSMRDCSARCLYRDGCGACNQSVWRMCIGNHCAYPNNYRVPAELVDAGMCACFEPCVDCQRMMAPYNLAHVSGGDRVCDACLSRDYSSCDHCNVYFLDEVYDDHVSFCREDCTDECCYEDSGYIHDYSYTPHLQFRGSDTYYLGLELELNTEWSNSAGRVAEVLTDDLGELIYLKEDSSINEGFEMVTHPMSFDFARSMDWSVIDQIREEHSVRATNDCGLHIHVSKTAFDTTSHVYRWMRFIYRNAAEVQQLARRSESTYAAFHTYMADWSIHYANVSKSGERGNCSPPDESDWYTKTPGGLKRIRDCGFPRGTQRYVAINVENAKTFEMRFFASTVNSNELLAAIQFAHATVEYTRQLTANKVVAHKGLDFGTFQAWVADVNTDNRYDNLISEMNRLVG